MPPVVLPPREAAVADDADEPAAGDEDAEAVRPDAIELGEETLVVGDVSQLAGAVPVLFECPVRGRCENEMDAFRRDRRDLPRVAEDEVMPSRDSTDGLFDRRGEPRVLRDAGDRGLGLAEAPDPLREIPSVVDLRCERERDREGPDASRTNGMRFALRAGLVTA